MSEMGIETIGLYNGHSSLGLQKGSSSSRTVCQCCPYGYHIDLGFVEFCDRLAMENREPSTIKTERRERRRQRQSMEVLLGLTNPMFWNVQQFMPTLFLKTLQKHSRSKMRTPFSKRKEYPPPEISEVRRYQSSPPPPPPRISSFICDSEGLKKAVQDFEATLERTTKLSPRSAPTSISERLPTTNSSQNEHFNHQPEIEEAKQSADVLDGTSATLGNAPLQNIREQMAISLEKIKEMEYQVRALPLLEEQITNLKSEKKQLFTKVSELTNQLALKNKELEKQSRIEKTRVEKKVISRDVGVLCAVKCRDVGTTGFISTRTVSIETTQTLKADKSTATEVTSGEALNQINIISLKDLDKVREVVGTFERHVSKSTQTSVPEPSVVLEVIEKKDVGIQSENDTKTVTRDTGVIAKPKTFDVAVEKKPQTRDCSVSEDTVNNLLCDRCKVVRTKSVGVGIGNVKEPAPCPGSGLANRSKSFDFSARKHTRSIGVSTIPPVKKLTATKQVGTVEITIVRKHVGCNTVPLKTRDAYTNAIFVKEKETRDCKNLTEKELSSASEEKESKKESLKEVLKDGTNISKIPRPTGVKTPVMNRRKFVRQDTYSKTMSVGSPASSPIPGVSPSKLKSSPDKSEPVEDQVQVTLRKKNLKPVINSEAELEKRFSSELLLGDQRASIASTSGNERYSGIFDDGGYDYDEHYGEQESNRNSQMFPESALFQPIQEKSREKLVPSKEMKAAMKVVNDGLHKYPSGLPKHLKTASSIIQQEWFKISSTATANPLDVEDYLDNFEEVSSTLLEFVVNMVDNNGNTAMHYAVSHGNFDVVSILLDSKVCNINKANAAGYTCVMLVSLAQVRSDTHREVVRRLFLLADVNVRAKQHGQTALMLAVSHGRLDMVQLLLEAGADPNIQDCDGSTALMCAAEHGHLEIVKQILAHPDCDPSIVDCDGSSALAIAMEAGNRDIGVLLYAREHFAPNSRGSSPYTSVKQRRSRPSSSPHPKTPTSPGPGKRSDHSF